MSNLDPLTALQPFLPCDVEKAKPEDWLSAGRVLIRRLSRTFRSPAPDLTFTIREIGLHKINAHPPACYEAVQEILEYASDYIAVEDTEVGSWIRLVTERELIQRFGGPTAERLLRQYVDPAPPGEPAYGEDGILKTVDLSERRVVPWLVPDMIPAATVGMDIGPYSCGKTFKDLALALSVAFGREWMGRKPDVQGHVHYVAAEGLASFDKRLAGWLVRHGELSEEFTRAELADVLEGRFTLSGGNLRLDDPKLEDVLIRTIRENGTKLLVLDTLGRLLGSDQSEDSNDTANAVMGSLQRVAAPTGCTILIPHHPGHTNQYRGRGGSAWAQAADFVLVAQGDLRDGKPVRLVNTKQRDAELFEDMAYRLRSVPIVCDGEGSTSAVFEAAPVSQALEIALAHRIRLDVQANPGATLGDVRARVTGDNGEIGAEVKSLVSDGKLTNKGSENRFVLYDNPEAWPSGGDEFSTDGSAPELSDLTE